MTVIGRGSFPELVEEEDEGGLTNPEWRCVCVSSGCARYN